MVGQWSRPVTLTVSVRNKGEAEFRAGIASPSGLELQEAMLGGSRGGQGKTKWRLGPK